MGSFQQPGYMPLAEWDYDGIAQAYPSGYLGNSHSQASDFGFGNELSTGSTMGYMPHGYGPQSIPAATFHLPSAPASARRQASSQRSTTSVEADEEKHSRRIKRTRTACEECRKRKQKCDGGEPCQSCEEQSTDCKYRDVPPTKKDDSMEKMVKLAETYNKTLANLNSDIDVMNATLRSIEARLNGGFPSWQQSSGYAHHSPSSSSPSIRRESE